MAGEMIFTFTVVAQVAKVAGPFATRESVAEELQAALEQADPGSLDGLGANGTSDYEVTGWDVTEG